MKAGRLFLLVCPQISEVNRRMTEYSLQELRLAA